MRRRPWRELLDVPVVVRSFQLEPSLFDAGVYAVVDAVRLDTVEPVRLTIGARRALEELERLREEGDLDHPMWLVVIDYGARPFLWLEVEHRLSAVVHERPAGPTVFVLEEVP